ncbi:DegV family protein [Xylocopilactobacillus apicola]|uniref:DegV family protein n=1 Tax=Xylocopilactobacillus apicola TaxID=2932184 RepID=A0AAU9DAN3_9LACO|nr:DegV family protein [Xylocopilactobacillus apicola]BDR58600.1 hypothetical protein XA3_10410 [Xylocopilactobacillus apicola]
MKIGLVTDSSATLLPEEIKKYNIEVVSIPVEISGKTYHEGEDISTEEFYDKLRNSKKIPKTSQPSIQDTLSRYQKLAQAGCDAIISIHITSTISGFVPNLEAEVKNLKGGPKIYVFDSWITVRLMGYLVLYAAKQIEKDGDKADPEQIIENLKKIRSSIGEYFIVNDLQNLVKGGRLSNASAFIGNILKIKPLLTFDDDTHQIVAFEKVRSIKRANSRIEELFVRDTANIDYPIKVLIIQGDDEEEAKRWVENLKARFPNYHYEISYFGPVVGTHLGDKSIGLTWLMDFDQVFLNEGK